jgi:hypothetical protein
MMMDDDDVYDDVYMYMYVYVCMIMKAVTMKMMIMDTIMRMIVMM